MDTQTLRDKIRAAITKAGAFTGIDTFRRIQRARQRELTPDERAEARDRWLKSRDGRRAITAAQRKTAARARRTEIATLQRRRQDALTRRNQQRAIDGDFDGLPGVGPDLARNVQRALDNAKKATR